MKIGIDIDGVLTDIEKWQLDYGSKFFYEKYKKSITNYKGLDTINIFEVNKKQNDEFWSYYFKDYCINISPREFAKEITKRLIEDGNEVYIITARGSYESHSLKVMSYEENKKIAKEWLDKNGIAYNKIIFTPDDKLDICISNKIDLMIEDNPKNIKQISSKIPVICFHANYNEDVYGKNIIRCYTWWDIYKTIYEIRN